MPYIYIGLHVKYPSLLWDFSEIWTFSEEFSEIFFPPLSATQPIVSVYFTALYRAFSLLAYQVTWSHTTTRHNRYYSSERMISPSQRPLPDKTQHSQQTNIHVPRWDSNPTISARERPKTYALERATTGTVSENIK